MTLSNAAQPDGTVPEDRAELEEIGLVYTTDATGISRRRRGTGFSYHLPDGMRVTDETILQRIRRLALPPAYERVWISLDPRGHLQATGFDARGRKQYRYHADWATWRSNRKFDDLVTFGHALPATAGASCAISKIGPRKPVLLSALVSLLDVTYMRVGQPDLCRGKQDLWCDDLAEAPPDL